MKLTATNMIARLTPIFFLAFSLAGCNRDKLLPKNYKTETLFTLIKPEVSHIGFANLIDDTTAISYFSSSYIYNGGGVAAGDLNNDGLQDLIFTGNQVAGKVYLNKGDFHFEDITSSAGFDTKVGWTTGVTLADVNGDGWLDIYIGKAVSEDPAKRANLLFINQHDLTFKEQARDYGLADTSHTIHANFFDIDNDGDLDAYILEYPHDFNITMDVDVLSQKTNSVITGVDRLYRNDNGKFTDITVQSGLAEHFGFGLSATATDINFDGYTDLFVANDYLNSDNLFINQGNGTFKDESKKYFNKISFFSMGSDFGDINNDQQADLLVVDMAPIDNYRQKMLISPMSVEFYNVLDYFGLRRQYFRNMLQLRTDQGFAEIGEFAGVAKTDWSWGAMFADWDNDGYQDIYIAKGTKRDLDDLDYTRLLFPDDSSQDVKHRHEKISLIQGMPVFRDHNYIFRNNGDLTFTQKMQPWGVNQKAASNGCAYADLDNDGDLDLIVNNTDIPAFVYRNNEQQQQKNNWLRVKVAGEKANTFGIGTKCYLFAGNQKMVRELISVRGYQSCSEPFMHFGLGQTKSIDSLIIEFPGGKVTNLYQVEANQMLVVEESKAEKGKLFNPNLQQKEVFTQKAILNNSFVHRENAFNDFKRDRLLHRMYSKDGPGIAVGDINGDGLDDFYVGQASGAKGAFYFQTKEGQFVSQSRLSNPLDSLHEQLGVLLVDVNNDGANDLIINSGSNEFDANSSLLGTQLFLNDGKGNFIARPEMLPPYRTSASGIIAADFDKDGYTDLFIGGRITPGRYPLTPESYLLKNNAGKGFENVTSTMASGLSNAGMITSSLFSDYDNDGWIDLVVVGEWMPITVFKNISGKKFEQQSIPSLSKTQGWWNSINGGDFDNDGDIDYVIGNWGSNCLFKASENEPVELYAADFDKNGSIDPILTYFIQGRKSLFATRDMLCEKMPSFFNKFNTYKSFATAPIEKILNPQQLDTCMKLQALILKSCYLENQGGGNFAMHTLPGLAQTAPVFGTAIEDFNGDGNLDILLSGNAYSFYIDQGNMDAGRGLLLAGDGANGFIPLEHRTTGFFADKDAKALAVVSVGDKSLVLLQANNNEMLQTFVFKTPQTFIKVPANATYAEMNLPSGKKRKVEFYNGCGYLSQSSRILSLPDSKTAYQLYFNK